MNMANLLTPDAVRVFATFSSKKRLFQYLGELVESVHGLDAATAASALQEREGLGTTGVGHGVALPHARLAGTDRVVGAFIKLERPFSYGSVDKVPVDLVFALFAPRDAGVERLKALAYVSRTLREGRVCNKLRANSDPATLHAILSSSADSQAA